MRSKFKTHPTNLVAICFILCVYQLQVFASAQQNADSAGVSFSIKREVGGNKASFEYKA